MKAAISLQTPDDSIISIKIEMTYGQILYLHDTLKCGLKNQWSGPAKDFSVILHEAIEKLTTSYKSESKVET